MGHEEFAELAAGHALHALEPADEQRFLAHLDGCVECTRSLADFSEVAAGLAMTSTHDSSELPPQIWAGISARVHDGSTAAETAENVVTPLRRRPRPRWQYAIASAAAAVLLVTGLVTWRVAGSHSATTAVSAAVSACSRTTGCHVVPLAGSTIRTKSTYLLIDGQHVRIATSSLPTLDTPSEIYVLWQLPQNGRPQGVVAFHVTPGHPATVATGTMPLPYELTTAFAITREAGSTIPSSPGAPIAVGAASNSS